MPTAPRCFKSPRPRSEKSKRREQEERNTRATHAFGKHRPLPRGLTCGGTPNMADQLEQMKQKYQSVLTTIQQQGIPLPHANRDASRLTTQGEPTSSRRKTKCGT